MELFVILIECRVSIVVVGNAKRVASVSRKLIYDSVIGT